MRIAATIISVIAAIPKSTPPLGLRLMSSGDVEYSAEASVAALLSSPKFIVQYLGLLRIEGTTVTALWRPVAGRTCIRRQHAAWFSSLFCREKGPRGFSEAC